MTRVRRILFASDLSKASTKAFATAVALAKANRATLTILHVSVPYMPVVPEQARRSNGHSLAARRLLSVERRFVVNVEGLMTASCGRIETLVMRMQGDFLENPELTLTLPQARRRFAVDEITCKAVLGALVDAGVLANVHGGAYVKPFPRLARTAGAGAPGQRQRPRQRQSATRPFVGHAA